MKISLVLGWLAVLGLIIAPLYVAWQGPAPIAYRPADDALKQLAALSTEETASWLVKERKAHKKDLQGADLLVAAVSPEGKPLIVARADNSEQSDAMSGSAVPWPELDSALQARPQQTISVNSRMGGAAFRHEVFPMIGPLPTYLVTTAYRAPTTWLDWKLMSLCIAVALGLGLVALARKQS